MEVKGNGSQFTVDTKRFHLPGFKLVGSCPNCTSPFEMDFDNHHLAYPKVNQPSKVNCHCAECEHEWEILVFLQISLELLEALDNVREGFV